MCLKALSHGDSFRGFQSIIRLIRFPLDLLPNKNKLNITIVVVFKDL